jgi:hypothetical protein
MKMRTTREMEGEGERGKRRGVRKSKQRRKMIKICCQVEREQPRSQKSKIVRVCLCVESGPETVMMIKRLK